MGDEDLCFAVFDLEGQFFQRIERIEVDDRAAAFEDRVIVDDEGRRIGQHQADMDAFFDAKALQARRHPFNLSPKLPVGL